MNDLIKKIEDIINSQPVSYIASVDENGYPCTKAMLPPVKREGISTFYWHTNQMSLRVEHFMNNPKASIYFCDPENFTAVMLRGQMEIVDDPAIKKALWRDEYNVYYRGGALDGDFTILRFTSENGRLYKNYNTESFNLRY